MSFPLDNIITFYPSARYASGTNLANVHGSKASSTNSCEVAAVNAAWKHFTKVLNLAGEKAEDFTASAAFPLGGNLYRVTFTRKETT